MNNTLKAIPCTYETKKIELNRNEDVLNIVKNFIQSNTSASPRQEKIILNDIENTKNHVINLDSDNEKVQRLDSVGIRVAYGAFRYKALEHNVQTYWNYTFEILDCGNKLYLFSEVWGWTPEANLNKKVKNLL